MTHDAPIDAAPQCPALGGTPPFSTTYELRLQQNCTSYHFSYPNDAIGHCQDVDRIGRGDYAYYNLSGPEESILTPVPSIPQSTATDTYDGLRVTALATIIMRHKTSALSEIQVYADDGTGNVIIPRRAPIAPTAELVAAYAVGDRERFILSDGSTLSEWSWTSDTTLEQVGSNHASAEVGLAEMLTLATTTDGLRAAISGRQMPGEPMLIYYADRTSTDVWFSTARKMLELQDVADLDLADDCGTLWFPSQGVIFSVAHDFRFPN